MKIPSLSLAIAGLSLLTLVGAKAQSTSTITAWTFDNLAVATNNSPTPSTGLGTATGLGMNNSYNSTNSINVDDVIGTAGSSTPGAGATNSWRIRGGGTAPNGGNGWSSQAPIGTQGAEFDASTVGYNSIHISFDLYFTTQAEAKMAVEYTTNGTTWLDVPNLSYATTPSYIKTNSSSALTINGVYFDETGGQAFYNGISADLSGVSNVNSDSAFGIRIVNASTGADDVNYLGSPYNNSSGNVRFDNVAITGTLVPEPSSYALLIGGIALLAGFVIRRKRA